MFVKIMLMSVWRIILRMCTGASTKLFQIYAACTYTFSIGSNLRMNMAERIWYFIWRLMYFG